jgi:bifunctional non-homologous end joining protein LigD
MAPKQSVPEFVPPELCETAEHPPSQDDWVHEIKLDGYRIQIHIDAGKATLRTRKGLDWTHKFPEMAKAAAKLPDCIIDGEAVAVNAHGAPDFAALQAALSTGQTKDLIYFAFDQLVNGGRDLREEPLHARKATLEKLLRRKASPQIKYVEHFETGGMRFALGMPARTRRYRLKEAGCALRLWAHFRLAQDQVPRRP